MIVVATAPGKAFLVGEYAVLTGAPALVTALDRRVTVRIEPASDWSVSAQMGTERIETGLALTGERLVPDAAATEAVRKRLALLDAILGAVDLPVTACPPARISLDSTPLYKGPDKLGLGSSAALAVALIGALSRYVSGQDSPTTFAVSLEAHRRFQGGRGSGADIATACRGGALRFETGPPPVATPVLLPETIAMRWFWAGRSANTRQHVETFSAWLGRDLKAPALVARLCDAALIETGDGDAFVAGIRGFTATLRALDDAACLGIYSDEHRRLAGLAADLPLAYKPCGAGGGDLGLAVGSDPAALDVLEARARDIGIASVALHMDPTGLRIEAF